MKASFSRTVFREPNPITSIGQIRERIFNMVLLISTIVLGMALFAISFIPVFENGLPGISIAYTILFAWLLVILFVHRIPYLIRIGSWVLILYALGVVNLFQSGFSIIAGQFFLAFVAMTTVLMGLLFGLTALLLSGVTISIIGVLTVNGIIRPVVELIQVAPMYWIAGGIVFLVMGILLSIPLAALVNSLDIGLIKATSLAGKLEQANSAFRADEERFRAIVEVSTDIICILGIDGTVQYINPCVEQILGYKMEELIGRKIYDYLHPNDLNVVVAAMTPGVPPEEIGPSLELRLRHRDGSWRILEVRGKEMHTNPVVNGTIVICRDITERKENEKALLDSHQLLTMVLANLTDAVFILDAETTNIMNCNPAASEIFGYSREELISHTTAFLYIDPTYLEEFRRHLYPAIKEKGFLSHFEFQMKRKDGTIFPSEHSVMPLVDPQAGSFGWVSVVHDITLRKSLEQKLQKVNEGLEFQVAAQTRELQEREKILRAIVEATHQSIILADLNGIIFIANEIAAKRMNVNLQDFLGACIWDLMPPELARSRKANVNRVVHSGKMTSFQDERVGIWLESNIYPIYNRDGHVDRIVLFAVDITEKKNALDALQESEEKYRTLAEAAHDMVYVINEDDRIEYVNSYAARLVGLRSEDLIGKSRSTLFPDDVGKHQREAIAATLASGSPTYSENWIKYNQKEDAYISTWLVPFNFNINSKRSVLGVSRDITTIQRMQEELQLTQTQLEMRVAERTKESNDLSAELRKLAKMVITTQEVERRRISRELHDDTGQVLVTLKYSLAELLNKLPANHDFLHKWILDSIKATDIAIASVRAIAHSLHPPLLDVAGLNVSLKDFCQDINRRTKIKVNYYGVELNNLSDDIAVALYRFVQEAFSNILKHSQATRVSVRLQYIRQRIILTASDNGVGIHDPRDTNGIGLIGLSERMGFLGGELQIKSLPGKGTIIKASIPWKDPDIEA